MLRINLIIFPSPLSKWGGKILGLIAFSGGHCGDKPLHPSYSAMKYPITVQFLYSQPTVRDILHDSHHWVHHVLERKWSFSALGREYLSTGSFLGVKRP